MNDEPTCSTCGSPHDPDALFCAECGAPVAPRRAGSTRDRLPWILSGLALVAFAVAISLMIGDSVGERAPGMPSTGGVISGAGATDAAGPTDATDAAGPTDASNGPGEPALRDADLDPSSVDLSSMSARDAADRLFDRALRTEASGDTVNARFFADMGLRAYSRVPPAEMDLDARFHVGLLDLMGGDTAAARDAADAMIAEAPRHLLAWILRARIAEARGDENGVIEARERFLEALDTERAAGRPEYEQHARLIDRAARRFAAGS